MYYTFLKYSLFMMMLTQILTVSQFNCRNPNYIYDNIYHSEHYNKLNCTFFFTPLCLQALATQHMKDLGIVLKIKGEIELHK